MLAATWASRNVATNEGFPTSVASAVQSAEQPPEATTPAVLIPAAVVQAAPPQAVLAEAVPPPTVLSEVAPAKATPPEATLANTKVALQQREDAAKRKEKGQKVASGRMKVMQTRSRKAFRL
jgi:hypothetical protein